MSDHQYTFKAMIMKAAEERAIRNLGHPIQTINVKIGTKCYDCGNAIEHGDLVIKEWMSEEDAVLHHVRCTFGKKDIGNPVEFGAADTHKLEEIPWE